MKILRRLGRYGETLLPAVAFALVFRVAIAQAYVIEGPSMQPNLISGDRVWVSKSAYGLSLPLVHDAVGTWALPVPGEVVIFESPAAGEDLVKRVAALPGDLVEIVNGHVFRNGVSLTASGPAVCDAGEGARCRIYDESNAGHRYRIMRTDDARRTRDLRVRVPPGHVFVLGDHRDVSNDSRAFGPVPVTRLRGRVLFQ